MSRYDELRDQGPPRMLKATVVLIEHDDDKGLQDALTELLETGATELQSTGTENPRHFKLKRWTHPTPGGIAAGKRYERELGGYCTELVKALREAYAELTGEPAPTPPAEPPPPADPPVDFMRVVRETKPASMGGILLDWAQCPFCDGTHDDCGAPMERIEHDPGCAWLKAGGVPCTP